MPYVRSRTTLVAMRHGTIEFRGTYLYVDPAALELALAAARERITADDDLDIQWLRGFIRHGARLYVRAELPATVDRDAAAGILEALARSAVEGVVEALHAGRAVDFFPCRGS
jgi:hypothetical protein